MLNLLVRSLSEMRNLKNVAFEEVESPDSLPLSATAWDTQNDTTICAFGPSSDKPVIELKRKSRWSRDFQTVASWDAPCPLPDLPSDEVVLLQYFADTSTSCLVLAGGDIVVVRDDPLPDQERIEIVGSVDVGIAAAAWAPGRRAASDSDSNGYSRADEQGLRAGKRNYSQCRGLESIKACLSGVGKKRDSISREAGESNEGSNDAREY